MLPIAGQSPVELYQAGRYRQAAEALEKRITSLSSQKPLTPDDQLERANTALALGLTQLALAEDGAAITALQSALVDYEAVDATPSLRANALDNLARAHQQAGQLAQAETTFREALSWRERDPSEEGAYWFGITRDHLALLLLTSGSYREAGEILAANLQATPPDETALLAQRHHYFARYLHTIRNFHRATEHAQKSITLARRDPSLDLSSYLDLLALSQYRAGDQAGAEASLFEALQELRTHPINLPRARSEAEVLNKIGEFSLSEEPALARQYFQEALDGLADWLPEDHPSLAVYRNNLGLAFMRLGRHPEAKEAFTAALSTLANQVEGLAQGHQRQAEWQQNLAWNTLLSGEAEHLALQVAAACQSAESALQDLLASGTERERLNFLAQFDLYSLPAAAGDAELLGGLLARNKALLLDTLIANKADKQSKTANHPLPSGAALIDFVRYQKPTNKGWRPHYGAVVEVAGQPRQFIPLGPERVLLRWLHALSERLSYRAILLGGGEVEPPLIRMAAALQQLHRHFLAPALAALPAGVETLVISPDGSLHFLPFAVLLDAEGQFFCQSYSKVLTVSSRRDLFHHCLPINLRGNRWELFGVSRYAPEEGKDPWFLEELRDLPFVEKELKDLKRIAPPATRLTLDAANPESEMKALQSGAAVLHLATHAFFREPEAAASGLTDLDAHPEILLRSGLALSGVESGNDGVLYPHEIAALPLHETQLVTLSACQTGLGTPLAGEGVLGLRRAFAIAGAQNVVMTLWEVPDQSTATFILDFYRRAIRTRTIGPALWTLQGERLASISNDLSNDVALEEAVLRYGSFIATHRGAIPLPEVADRRTSIERKTFWWRYLLWIIAFGSLIAGVIRFASRRGLLEE